MFLKNSDKTFSINYIFLCLPIMKVLVYLFAASLLLHACDSYIMLTANMEDVNALARQLAASPVLQQVKKIWRRASTQFRKELERHSRRQGKTSEDLEDDIDTEGRTKRIIKDLVALGREAGYIEPMKQVLEKLQ